MISVCSIRFWQSQGDLAIFEAVTEMLNDYFLIRGLNADESGLQRTVENFEKHKIRISNEKAPFESR